MFLLQPCRRFVKLFNGFTAGCCKETESFVAVLPSVTMELLLLPVAIECVLAEVWNSLDSEGAV